MTSHSRSEQQLYYIWKSSTHVKSVNVGDEWVYSSLNGSCVTTRISTKTVYKRRKRWKRYLSVCVEYQAAIGAGEGKEEIRVGFSQWELW